MPTFRVKGIVIKKNDIREADKIFTIFTDNLGKVSVVGRGTSKINSKLGGHLDLFTLVDLSLVQGKSLFTVVHAQALESFKNLKSDLSKTGMAFYAAELVNKLVFDEYKDTRVFKLIYDLLLMLDREELKEQQKITSLFQSFELKLLKLLGFLPELEKCISCKKPLENKINYFDISLSGVSCSDCGLSHQLHEMSGETLKFLRLLEKENFDFIIKLRVKGYIALQAKKIIDQYIIYLIEKKLKSPEFIKKIEQIERNYAF